MATRRETRDRSVARLLDATPDLLPYLPELLRDLDSLGSTPNSIVRLLQRVELPAGSTRALDLGCGKGEVAIRLAQEFGFRVDGVDLFPAFVREARRRAEERGAGEKCRFRTADVREIARAGASYDLTVFASMGGVFPDLLSTVGALRSTVRPGGFVVLEDGFLEPSSGRPPEGYGYYCNHEETLACLKGFGDDLVGEVLVPREHVRKVNEDNFRAIARRASDLAGRHPELASRFRRYVAEQARQGGFAESVETAIWLLRKRP